jgi:hypothetical protein
VILIQYVQFNEATVFVGDLDIGNNDDEEVKFYSNDSETIVLDGSRPEASGLRPLTSSNSTKNPPLDSRPVTRNGTRDNQALSLPPRPMTQQSQRLRTPGYDEMLSRRAKFERIVTPVQHVTRVDTFRIGSPVPKSPSRIDVLKSLRQSPDAIRPRTSSASHPDLLSRMSPQPHIHQSVSISSDAKKETVSIPLDDIAERVVKLLKERNYSTDKKVLDFLGTL